MCANIAHQTRTWHERIHNGDQYNKLVGTFRQTTVVVGSTSSSSRSNGMRSPETRADASKRAQAVSLLKSSSRAICFCRCVCVYVYRILFVLYFVCTLRAYFRFRSVVRRHKHSPTMHNESLAPDGDIDCTRRRRRHLFYIGRADWMTGTFWRANDLIFCVHSWLIKKSFGNFVLLVSKDRGALFFAFREMKSNSDCGMQIRANFGEMWHSIKMLSQRHSARPRSISVRWNVN